MRYGLSNTEVAVAERERIKKAPIENHSVLNEAYDYSKKVSFPGVCAWSWTTV
ncbi:MAG: hypothetical protein ACYS0D_13860 [Planctomycetota bacterium]|jgi:hypothetical protein